MRKIYHQEFVDENTGEITRSNSVYIGKGYENFGMFRTTDCDWIYSLSGDELKLLMLLYVKSDYGGVVVLSKRLRDEICELNDYSGRTFSRLLNGLVEKDVLKMLGRFEFAISPSTFFKGASKDLKNKIREFNL